MDAKIIITVVDGRTLDSKQRHETKLFSMVCKEAWPAIDLERQIEITLDMTRRHILHANPPFVHISRALREMIAA